MDNLRKGLKRIWLLVLLLALCTASPLAADAQEESPKVVRVGWYESNYCYRDRFGRRRGICCLCDLYSLGSSFSSSPFLPSNLRPQPVMMATRNTTNSASTASESSTLSTASGRLSERTLPNI